MNNQQILTEMFRTDREEIFFNKLFSISESNKSGYFDLPKQQICNHPEHNPPTHLYIPPGKGYKHICPGCGKEKTIIPIQITF